MSEESCHELNPSALCTAESIEPGAVGVCDVACGADADCTTLGESYTCEGGFCRGGEVTPPPNGSGGLPGNSDAPQGDFLLDDSDGYDPVEGTTILLRFSDDELLISAGCNTHSSVYTVEDGILTANQWSGTALGCAPEYHAQDEWLVTFIGSGPTLTAEGDYVTLTGEDATLVFLDKELADPDRPLIGNTWEVSSLITGSSAALPVVTPTFTFNDDGTVAIFSGCNTGEGSYEVDGDEITLSAIGFTEMACSTPEANDVEHHMQLVFAPGIVTYSIDTRFLNIDRNGVGIQAATE